MVEESVANRRTTAKPGAEVAGRTATDPVISTGVDLCSIKRIGAAYRRQGERFLKRVFTRRELDYCARYRGHRYLAALAVRFAAKEALAKALGTGLWGRTGLAFQEIEVISNEQGKPSLYLKGKAEEVFRKKGGINLSLSLTHEQDMALAVCQLLCAQPAQSLNGEQHEA